MDHRILLADDSVTVQKIVSLTFSDEGVDVVACSNGEDAIHRLQTFKPSLVMADVSLPGKNGYELCEYIKRNPALRGVPVMLLVPAYEPFDEKIAQRVGADRHLTKPFQSIRMLVSTVRELIETSTNKNHRNAVTVLELENSRPVRLETIDSVLELDDVFDSIPQPSVTPSKVTRELTESITKEVITELSDELIDKIADRVAAKVLEALRPQAIVTVPAKAFYGNTDSLLEI